MCLWTISLSWCNQLEIAMKRYFGVVAAAALLAGTVAVATDGLAAGHGRAPTRQRIKSTIPPA
jgi:hypothetical protein